MSGRSIVSAALLATAAGVAVAQDPPGAFPPRPDLGPGADTNSAAAYYARGVDWLARNPGRSVDAFHWSTLLNPSDGAAFYGRAVALLLSQPRRLIGWMERNPSALRSPELRTVDSLLGHALALDPFLFRELDERLVTAYIQELIRRDNPRVSEGDLQFEVANYLRNDAAPHLRAMVAYTYRSFPRALDQLDLALRTVRDKTGLHGFRALVHHHMGQLDSAAAAIQAELEALRRRDSTEISSWYESKAVLELSAGRLLEARGDAEGAYAAYLRSAAEDLGFAPAHVHLAVLALQRGDTSTALSETAIAIDAQSHDPALLVNGSLILISAGRLPEALPHLLKARELNPFYPTPHYLLARLHDVAGMPRIAAEHYQAFLERASQADTRVPVVRERLGALGSDSGRVSK